jgi:O-antigen/teichoic acid export membrane protein
VNSRFIQDTLQRVTGKGDLGEVLRAAGAVLAIRMVGTVLAYVSILALARWMGAAEYGAYIYAISWATLLAMPAVLGIPVASVRFLPEYSALDRWGHVRGLLERSLLLILATSAAIALCGIGIVLLAGERVPLAYHTPLIIALAGVPIMALLILGSQTGRAFAWVWTAYAPSQVWHPFLFLIITGAAVAVGRQLTASWALIVSLAITLACVLVQGVIYVRRLAPKLRNIVPQYEQRMWLRVSLPLLFIDGFTALVSYSDILMVGFLIGPAPVAFYTAASRTANLVTFFFNSVSALSGPRIAELYAQGRKKELQDLLSGIVPWITAPATAVTIFLGLAGTLLLPLFGKGFEVAWLALIILAVTNLVTSIAGPALLLLNMTGHQDISAKVLGLAAAANVGINIVLIPRYGITGAAVATLISTTAGNVALAVIAHRTLGIRTSIFAGRRTEG